MTDDEFGRLIGTFYEGVLSPQSWQAGLAGVVDLTSSANAAFTVLDRHLGLALVADGYRVPEQGRRDYAAHYHTVDPGVPFFARHPNGVDGWYLDERDLGLGAMQRSPYYREYLRRGGIDSVMSTPLMLDGGVEAYLTLNGLRERRNLVTATEKIRRVLPHLRRATGLRTQLLSLSQQLALSKQVLDRLQMPLFVMAPNRTVTLANALGEQWLSAAGHAFTARSTHAKEVSAMLCAACGVTGPVRASGVAVRSADGAATYLTAVPLPQQAAGSWLGQHRLALVWVNDPGRSQPSLAVLLRQLFRLTQAEVRCVQSLLGGLSAQEAAAQLGVSINTFRVQLKSVFAKLHITRQSDLHRVLGGFGLITPD